MNRHRNRHLNRWAVLFAAGIAVSVLAAQAHHSVSGMYDTSTQMTFEGVVAQFHFVNPHPYVTLEVRKEGVAQRWYAEMDNLRELADVGMDAESLKPGDQVVVIGNPVRTKEQRLYIRKLTRTSDGFEYEQVGRSPEVRRVPVGR